VGETSKYALLFTRELGFLSARAQGARASRSKLRYHLTDFSYLDAWLVRGREVWRLANAVSRANFFTTVGGATQSPVDEHCTARRGEHSKKSADFYACSDTGALQAPTGIAILARASALLRRLLPPDEPHSKLFDAVVSGFSALTAARAESERQDVEILLALRILYHLGYIGEPKEFLSVAESSDFGVPFLSSVAPLRRTLVSVINSSLRLTGL